MSRFRKNRLGGPKKESSQRHRRPRGSFTLPTSQLGLDKLADPNYKTALRSLERFLTIEGIDKSPLTRKIVVRYDSWLAEGGVSSNTRSCYLRSLRALYNRVGGSRRRKDLFAEVFTGNAPTPKRALSVAEIRRVRSLDMTGDRLFPLVPCEAKGEQAVRLYRAALARYNRQLRQMAEQAGVRKTLSSYVARHSWATLAYNRG